MRILPLFLLLLAGQTAFSAANHPLEPLSAAELGLASDLIKNFQQFPKGALFPLIALKEPPKTEVLAFKPGNPFRREALATVLDRAANKTYEAVVDLNAKKVASWKFVPGVQPLVLVTEYDEVPKIVKADPRWQASMKKRGFTDFEKIWVDTWALGSAPPKGSHGARLLRGISYLKEGASNFYGRPIEGVVAIVDMNAGKIVDFIDTGVVPVAKVAQELDPKSLGEQRKDVKPLKYNAPDGPSFQVNGNEIRWQNWRFRFQLHPREGLVLYQVSYDDHGKVRPILYRASLSETVVPYGDPDKNWSWRNAFDEGEYGMGRLTSTLTPGMDAPENAVFFDADFVDDFGKPYKLEKSVTLYEREGGYLWKHFDIYTNKNEARRARDLVLYNVAAIGNYDYVFSWIFHQDGAIDVDVGLSGIMLPKGVPTEAYSETHHHDPHSHLVAKFVAAPHHQHFLNYRLDFDVDGEKNSVAEINTRAMPPGPANPSHNGIMMEAKVFKTAPEARRDVDLKSSRKWLIENTGAHNSLGYNTAYALIPGDNSIPYLSPNSLVRKRAGFINHHFWVTKYKEDETYAGGYYPNQSSGGEGLERWAANKAGIENEDVVVWYTMGLTHVPRPEEWPVMPMTHIGFKLIPAGFFDQNPSLDVPR